MVKWTGLIQLAQQLGCTVRENEPLSNHTTFRIGGPCRVMVWIKAQEEICELIKYCYHWGLPFFVLGKGSNLLVDDCGYSGVIFKLCETTEGIQWTDEETMVCEAGVSLKTACQSALEHGKNGLAFAWGIPGSVGGAVYMNAGAYGGQMSDIVSSIEILDENGRLFTLSGEELGFSYRKSIFNQKNYLILRAHLHLLPGDREEIQKEMTECLNSRKTKQPLEFPSAGSMFKRPQGAYAAALIDQCGLKGKTCGDAQVSQKHAGFIVNLGNATFSDVMELVRIVRRTVMEKTGYLLECEPRILSLNGLISEKDWRE